MFSRNTLVSMGR